MGEKQMAPHVEATLCPGVDFLEQVSNKLASAETPVDEAQEKLCRSPDEGNLVVDVLAETERGSVSSLLRQAPSPRHSRCNSPRHSNSPRGSLQGEPVASKASAPEPKGSVVSELRRARMALARHRSPASAALGAS